MDECLIYPLYEHWSYSAGESSPNRADYSTESGSQAAKSHQVRNNIPQSHPATPKIQGSQHHVNHRSKKIPEQSKDRFPRPDILGTVRSKFSERFASLSVFM